MKDKFVLNYGKLASKAESDSIGAQSRRSKPPRHNSLHDHRTCDAMLEYLDDLEE